jgi:hypothetical protein
MGRWRDTYIKATHAEIDHHTDYDKGEKKCKGRSRLMNIL